MSKLLDFLKKPEYIFRPKQVYSRLTYSKKCDAHKTVLLPWGMKLRVHPDETLGQSLCTLGVYDLSVTEMLWRLVDVGEQAIDVGANIGYMTSILAIRVGPQGKVYAFEPHPEIFGELSDNIKLWQEIYALQCVEPHRVALSNHSGIGTLREPGYFNENRGVAFLLRMSDSAEQPKGQDKAREWPVQLNSLDELIEDKEQIKFIKLDVEGHELEVLEGANELISCYVRDIIFEDHGAYPTPAAKLLEQLNYTIFRIAKGIFKPYLERPISETYSSAWEPPSYLATKDVPRALRRMTKLGWRSLGSVRSV
ncbi:MAG TPA: FkbM family methyltransferase [Pyrinomonadaceae bacterium]